MARFQRFCHLVLLMLSPLVVMATLRQSSSRSQHQLARMADFGIDASTIVRPSTPRPEDVNCYITVPTTVVRGGQCVRLGRSTSSNYMYGCRAGVHLKITEDCAPSTPAPVPVRGRGRGRDRGRGRGRGGGRGGRRGLH